VKARRMMLLAGALMCAASVTQAQDEGEAAPEEEAIEAPNTMLEGWEGSIELGLSGSTGNTEQFNVRAGIGGDRLTKKMETRVRLTYQYGSEDGDKTKDRLIGRIRNDWLTPEGNPWRYWATGEAEYDAFQDWDWRWAVAGGLGYEFILNDKTTLIGRAGVGLNQKLGGEENKIVAEGILGVDWIHQLTERQKIFVTADYFQAFDYITEFRARVIAGWEILVDPEVNLALKLGIEDRYDTRPGDGNKKNDLDYFAVLVYSF
jgi:putative salt-induced outer membrane protein YdiY